MKPFSLMLILMAGSNLVGCTSREVVYLGSNTTKTVRLRETVRQVKVWVKNEQGATLPAKTDLLEGGYYRSDLNQ